MRERRFTKRKREYALYCPECGKRLPGDSVYCEFCGTQIWGDKTELAAWKEYVGENSVFNRKSAVTAGTICLFFLCVFYTLGTVKMKEQETFFYIKDNSIYGYNTELKKTEQKELSVRYFEKWSSRTQGGPLPGRNETEDEMTVTGTAPAYSPSGRYFYYMESGIKDSFNLIRTDLKKKESKTLDSGVVEFFPAADDKVVYKKDSKALYYYDGKRKNKISSETVQYRINEAGNRLVFVTEEDGVTDIYSQLLVKKSKPVRLERNAILLDASPKLDVFLIQKEDAVFLITDQGKKERLVKEVSTVIQADAGERSFYFLREEGEEASTRYKELYFYSKGKARLMDDSFETLVCWKKGVLLYTRTGEGENCMIAYGGGKAELGRVVSLPGQVRVDGEKLYFLTREELSDSNGKEEHELIEVSLSEPRFPSAVVDYEVSELACAYGGSIYYFKEMGNGTGDLYRDGKWMAYDVAVGSVTGVPGENRVLCIADSGSSSRRGTLTLLEEKDSKEIADKVFSYSAISGQDILILSDYNRQKKRGDLLRYNGRETELVEAGIWGYYRTGSSGICR